MARVTRSSVVVGWVRHRRHRPRVHAFRHRSWHLWLDVDELDRLERTVWGFGHERRAAVRFRDADHFGPSDEPVRAKLAALLVDHGIEPPDGRLQVLTYPRVAGQVFNPVSWWFWWNTDGTLGRVVAEVNNTFGDRHCYLLDHHLAEDGTVRARASKQMHVSPFLPIDDVAYRFVFRIGADRVLAHIDVVDDIGTILDATQFGRCRPLNTRSLWRAMFMRPLMPLWTVVLIHGHAVRLFAKRVRFHRRPDPPESDATHAVASAHSESPQR